MNHLTRLAAPLVLLIASVYANTEKVIFLAPPTTTILDASPGLPDLDLITLSPDQPSQRTSLSVAFPDEERPFGVDSWYLLQDLKVGQRHEVRVCWPAVQPTAFSLAVYELTHVFDTPNLVSSLAAYAEDGAREHPLKDISRPVVGQGSLLLLRVQAAADFFAANSTLMQSPPLVDVEIILDPYLANVFPQSLLFTAIYIATLAVGSWVLSGFIWKRFFPGPKQRTD